jgi:hypothetical protein
MGTNMVDRAIFPRYKCKLRKIQRLKKEVYNDFCLKVIFEIAVKLFKELSSHRSSIKKHFEPSTVKIGGTVHKTYILKFIYEMCIIIVF